MSKIALGPETLDIFKTKTEDYLNKAVALPVAVEPIRLNLDMDAGSGSSSGSGNSLWDMGRGKRDLIKRVPQVSQFQPSSQEAHNISSPVKNSSPTKRSFENIDSDGLGHCSGIVKRIGIEGVSEIGVLSDIDAMTDEYLSEADDVVIEKPTIRESPSKVAVKYSKIDLDNVRIEYQAEIQAKKDATIASINQLKEHINVDNREKTILEIQSCKEEYRSFALIKSGECASRLEELASNGIIEHPVIELESEYGQQTRMESSLQIRPGSLSLPSTQSQKLELSQPFEPVAEPFAKAKSNPLLMRNSVLKIKNLPQVDFVPTKRTLGFSAIFEVEYLPSSRNFNTQTDIVHTSDIGLSPIQNDVEIRLEIAPSPVKAPVQLSKIDVCDEESDEPTQEFFNSVDISKSVVLVNSPDPEISNLHHLLTSGGDSFPVNSYSPSLALEEALGVSLETVEPNTTSQQKQQLFTDDDLFSALDEQEMMNLEIPAVSQKQVGVTFAPNSPDLSANEQFQLKQSQSQDLLLDLLRVEKSYSNNVEYESFSVTKNSNVDDIIEVEETQSPDLVVMVNSNRAPLDETKFDLNEEHLVNYSEDEDILSLNEEPPQTQVESTQHPNSKQNDSVLAKLHAPMPDYKRMTLAELKVVIHC